jgi:Hsp90 protein
MFNSQKIRLSFLLKLYLTIILRFQGEVEFRSVLFIPGMAPLNNEDIVNPKTKNIRLYVKRVFISDDFDGELVYLELCIFCVVFVLNCCMWSFNVSFIL